MSLQWTTAVIGFALWICAGPGQAQSGNLPWQEYPRLIEQGREIAPLDMSNLFGDSVDLYSGGLSFSTTDVSIHGNNALPVAITRKLSIHDRRHYGGGVRGPFADWAIDIPNVNGVFAPTWHDNRCSQAVPPAVGNGEIIADEYWAGNHADLPGGGEMLRDSNRPSPSTGGPYLWVTQGHTYFSCLTTIDNGSGQGFLAIDSNGNKYWLDHMAQYPEPVYRKFISTVSIWGVITSRFEIANRKRNILYATRVEDRFGNWVTYSYANTYDQPVKLTAIASSDGRSLTLAYNGSGYVSSVTDGTRTWTYQYSSNSLTGVTLPDGSSWSLSMAGLSNAILGMANDPADGRTCFSLDFPLTGDVSGSLTHPSGATATFVVGPRELGRTNVPGVCRNYQPPGTPGNDTRDDFPVFPVNWFSLVVKSRQVQGPGVPTASWSYGYGSAWSWQLPPGSGHPVCSTTTCADPVCLSDSCAGTRVAVINGPDGTWDRYTFGNSYRYNEGKLLQHEAGGGPAAILKTTTHTYNYATSGQPYAEKIGTSPQLRGAGFVAEYPRPLVKTDIVQDGALFTWEVDTGCTTSGIHCLDTFARPIRVIRTGNTAGGGSSGPTVPPASAPTLTAPATSNTGSYTLSWTTVSLATAYELQEQLGSSDWASIQVGPQTVAPIDSRSSGSWSYRVRACNVNGCAAWSTTKTVVVSVPPTGAPALTAPATNTTGKYAVSWTSVPQTTRYELEQRKDAGAWSKIHDAAATSTELNWQASGTYDYRARACNAGGCGPDSAVATTVVTLAALGAPTLTAPASIKQFRPFTVSWTSVSGATSYVLERNFQGGAYEQVYSGSGTSTSQTLEIMGNYNYRGKACNSTGCGPGSATKTVTVTLGD